MSDLPTTAAMRCPQCGALLAGLGSVEGLCAGCLLGIGLSGSSAGDEREPGATAVPGLLQPLGAGVAAPLWAMPNELLREAARRLRDVSLGLGAASFAFAILLDNLIGSAGWYSYAHPVLKYTVLAGMTAASACVAWVAHYRQLAPRQLLRLGLAYEIAVALAISVGDHLEPLRADVPFASVSWLCVWIVAFPLVVPAPPLGTFLASLAAASTWPLAYLVGVAAGTPSAPARLLLLSSIEGYLAAALAMVAAFFLRRMQELGSYHLEERLDHGGMGEIWRARHHLLARPVAVKLIRPELLGVKTRGQAAGLVNRFRREAEATAALHSSHTVALHDFGMTREGVFYYVMDLLDGLDLDTLVRRFGPVPPERAIHLLMQACESLADAHAVGLIHRDVKPANLLTCRWGLKYDFVKVLDFGLVKAAWGPGKDDWLSSGRTIAGTPACMAPEVALGGRPLDARVDLYGLGCVAYWLLTGEKVFTGATPMEVVLNHVRAAPIPPSERAGRALPDALERLVLSCLAKEPRDRPLSAEWLGERLAECQTGEAWTAGRARAWWETNVTSASARRP